MLLGTLLALTATDKLVLTAFAAGYALASSGKRN